MANGELEGSAAAQSPGSTDSDAQLEELRRALAQAEERANGFRDQYLRSVAELDNIRKRTQREVDNAVRSGLEKFAVELLPIKDSLELAAASAAESGVPSLAEGLQATLRLLTKAFEKLNIQEIDPHGEPLDPARHEAVMLQDSHTAEPDTVLQVVQRGYELNGRLLRPARVIVARTPSGGARGPATEQNRSSRT